MQVPLVEVGEHEMQTEWHPHTCRLGASFNVVACLIHPKLHHINLHNVTHSLIFRNPMEWMFVVQISLLIVTFFSLISRILLIMQTTKEVNSHPRIAPCVTMWGATFFFFFFLCHLLNVGACICHIAQEGQVEWTTSHHEDVALYVIPWCHMLH